jgi:type IV pilus assembly protein PilY1
MKLIKTLFFVLFLSLMLAANSFGKDTDLYVGGQSNVHPNILIILDTSGSMDETVDTGCHYDPSTTYPTDPNHTDIVATKVYRKRDNGEWFPLLEFAASVPAVGCPAARTTLTTYDKGIYVGRPDWDASRSRCSGTQRTLATGNWLNFWLASDSIFGSMKKIDIAKTVTKNFLSNLEDVKVGLMRFGSAKRYGGYDTTEGGRMLLPVAELTDSHRADLKDAVDDLDADGYTPLAEVLYEAGLYFKGEQSYFNWKTSSQKVQYGSPMEYYCQKNYVVLMTDGMSTKDRNTILNTIGDQDNDEKEPPGAPNDPDYGSDGSDFLDDVAKYYYDNDLNINLQDRQNLVTYTIGFELSDTDPDSDKARDLLRRTATHGHGKFYNANNTAGLSDAFASILNEILAKTSSFVAPIVPVSRFERTSAGDKIYLALFKPSLTGMWKGNIKMYGVAQVANPFTRTNIGDILDKNNAKALDSQGRFYPSSKSYWSPVADGGEVELGGVGHVLLNRTEARKIYTFLPGDPGDEMDDPNTSTDLTNSWNALTTTNSRVTPVLLGVSTPEEKDQVVNFVHGYDAYDEDGNNVKTEKRDWILGSFLHSRPYIIHYSGRTVIYGGANDGMLHAFDSSNGEELWAFIPPCLLGRLQELHTITPGEFVDGSPKAYITYDADGITVTKAILIFGLRRGGSAYYALDVTDPETPKYLWNISPSKAGFSLLGQSWSTPMIGKIGVSSMLGTTDKYAAFIGGGYDEGQDEENPPEDDRGMAIYVVDVLTGALVWSYSRANDANMTYSIPSDIAKLDMDGDGRIDRLYVGDMDARMWRFDLTTTGMTGRRIFKSNFGASEKRKIFYPPDVTFEDGYEMLFIGTGDREAPKSNKDMDRIYALKDKNSMSLMQECEFTNPSPLCLVDVTEDLLQTGTATEKEAVQDALNAKSGWFIKLDKQLGEKCLASPVVFYRTAYYTTFSPTVGHVDDPCFVGEGEAWLYAVDYMNGNAVFNYDLTNDVGEVVLGKSDRIVRIGTAIPSGVIITVVGNTVVAYVGVGGGISRPTLKKTKVFYPVYWKVVF